MGTWGADIFDDDLALDVKGAFENLHASGVPLLQCVESIINEWCNGLSQPEERIIAWLALATVMLESGFVDENVRTKTLEIINNGSDLDSWFNEPKLIKRRKKVLSKLQHRLENRIISSVRKRKKPYQDSSPWDIGEFVEYRLASGFFTVFQVTGHTKDCGFGVNPIIEVLDYYAPEPASDPRILQPRPITNEEIFKRRSKPWRCRSASPNLLRRAKKIGTVSQDATIEQLIEEGRFPRLSVCRLRSYDELPTDRIRAFNILGPVRVSCDNNIQGGTHWKELDEILKSWWSLH